MTFGERALTLLVAAAWIPVCAGVFARLILFRRGKNVRDRAVDPPPPPGDDAFALETNEPGPDDPNRVPFEDRPTRGGL